ncbi:MAG: hypothetical protein L3J12_02525 [Spirochaetales bacterium]|nr:hypothetical protein [Spirochaetales bacterium]
MKKLFISIGILIIVSTGSLYAGEDILSYLSLGNRATLYSKGEISKYFFQDEKPEFLFNTDYKNSLLEAFSTLNITIGVESLYLIKYSDFPDIRNISLPDIYNTLLSVKTMKGIEYYSKSRQKMRTLFTESYEILNLQNLSPVEDPVFTAIPGYLKRYLLQTDKTFGENIYKTVYRFDGSVIWVNMINTTKMKYKFIQMVKPEKMSVNLFILPTDDGLLFYGVTAAETASFLGLEKTKKESFYNRIKAMYNWFLDQLM